MFLTPDDQQPFFGGTYFPQGAPSRPCRVFGEVLGTRLPNTSQITQTISAGKSAQLALAFERLMPVPPARGFGARHRAPWTQRGAQLEESFDSRSGGFGQAPKFPQPASLERCLRQLARHVRARAGADLKALYMATLTLTRMAEGGLYDQLGRRPSRDIR